jgi:hypothetical protein
MIANGLENIYRTRMKPLYSATIGDLTPLDYLQVECACGHVASVTAKDLAAAGVKPDKRIIKLQKWRCRECDRLPSGALVSVKWHDAPTT